MAPRFQGKVCVITGAASGIGYATAIKMASDGAILALCDNNEIGLADVGRACETGHITHVVDVSYSTACNDFIDDIIRKCGTIDLVFNCAGVNPTPFDLTATTDEYWDKLVNTNLRGTYNITRAVIPHLRAPGGSIVNVSSTMGIRAAADHAIYCATKFGIIGFTKAMALELGPKGIRVNAVAPGYIDTPTNSGVIAGPAAVQQQVAHVALGRMGTPDEVASVVAVLFSDETRYMNGSIVEVTGGIP